VAKPHKQNLDPESRARDIVAHMTLQEKLDELHGIQDANHFRYVPPIPRLHIPALRISNGPAGLGPGGAGPQPHATALPAPISLAATWDPALALRYGVVIGQESRDLGVGLLEGPDVNIARVPQCGRTFEAFGEDPFLVSKTAVAVIQGIQGQGVIANVKHYAANNQEINRLTINEEIDERALREIYLPAFEASVKEGHVASIMGAYPRVDGDYACESAELLRRILKEQWGFQGFVTSDFGAVHSTVATALAGLDLEMPTGRYFGSALGDAIVRDDVPMSVVDDKLVRRFRTMMEFGIFDHPPKPKPLPVRRDGEEARLIAEEGMVLLKNDGNALPLNPDTIRSIVLIGPSAKKAKTGGGGSSKVIPCYTVTPAEGIAARLGPKVNVTVLDGKDIAKAAAAAAAADAAIVMVGDSETEGTDHPLKLKGDQDLLVEAVAAANPHAILVLKTGSAVLMPWVDQVPAILEAWYPGEEDGNAVAAVLFGDVNPSGKLPLSFPARLADLPACTPQQYPGVKGVAKYSEGVFVGYRHFDANELQPLFPFGHGLSYTTFAYRGLSLSPAAAPLPADSDAKVVVEFDVANTGKRFGEEVAQLYLGFPSTDAIPQPPKQLKGFAKVPLRPGKSTHVRLELSARDLSTWDVARHGWSVLPGVYKVMVGSSSRDIRLTGAFTVSPD
jgi:beta-glucosidase